MTTDNITPPQRDLIIYTIYDHPSDYPNFYIIKAWSSLHIPLRQYEDFLFVSPELEPCRDLMKAKGLYRLDRDVDDDPVIVETWF